MPGDFTPKVGRNAPPEKLSDEQQQVAESVRLMIAHPATGPPVKLGPMYRIQMRGRNHYTLAYRQFRFYLGGRVFISRDYDDFEEDDVHTATLSKENFYEQGLYKLRGNLITMTTIRTPRLGPAETIEYAGVIADGGRELHLFLYPHGSIVDPHLRECYGSIVEYKEPHRFIEPHPRECFGVLHAVPEGQSASSRMERDMRFLSEHNIPTLLSVEQQKLQRERELLAAAQEWVPSGIWSPWWSRFTPYWFWRKWCPCWYCQRKRYDECARYKFNPTKERIADEIRQAGGSRE